MTGEDRGNRTSTMWVVTEELPIVSVSVMIPPDALTVTTEKSEYGYFVLNWMALSHKHRFLSCESQHLESEVWCAGQ